MDPLTLLNTTDYGPLPWFCWILAMVRVFWEFVGFDCLRLPLTRKMAYRWGKEPLQRFHRTGFWVCVGYVILYIPGA